MKNSDPLPLCPSTSDRFTKIKSTTPFNQVMMTCKDPASDMQRVMQVVQMVLRKGRRICQLFRISLDTLLCKRFPCCPAVLNRQPMEDKTAQVTLQTPPSTIFIINISNSTLINCVIGNDAYPSAVAENQPLMPESQSQMQGAMRCKSSCGQQGATKTSTPPPPPLLPSSAESQSIHISSSHLNYVIIGDNNSMQVEETH